MARIRSIKPDFWTSEQVIGCRPLSRLLFIGLWNFADDYGHLPFSPVTIRAQVFPGDSITPDEVREMLLELSSIGLVVIYSVDGKEYLEITGWHHQKIEKPHKPKCPKPFSADSDNLPEPSPNIQRTFHVGEERKGMEMKREGDGAIAPPARSSSRKKPATRLPDDWQPDQAGRDYAAKQGLSASDVSREVEKFKNYAKTKDRTAVDWAAAWRTWCVNAAQYLGRSPPVSSANPAGFKFSPGTPQFTAWRAYAQDNGKSSLVRILEQRELEGRSFEFDSEWPPGHKQAA